MPRCSRLRPARRSALLASPLAFGNLGGGQERAGEDLDEPIDGCRIAVEADLAGGDRDSGRVLR